MKLGFTLKKAKKPGLVAAAALGDGGAAIPRAFEAAPVKKEDEKVYVTDFDPTAIAPASGDNGAWKPTLVIPLLKTNAWRSDENEPQRDKQVDDNTGEAEAPLQTATVPLTDDELAAQQLLADANALKNGDTARKTASTLVIPITGAVTNTNGVDSLAGKRAELFRLADGEERTNSTVPILQQNAVPGLDQFVDVTDKYRHDVSLRPDELDVHSEQYSAVPVEDFGAAMLRGMGWKGAVENDKDEADDPKPRQRLLGLGATAKPKLPGDAKGSNRGKPIRGGDDKALTNGLNRRADDGDGRKATPDTDKRRDDTRDRPSSRSKSSRSRSRDRESSRPSRSSRDDDRRRDRSRSRDRDRRKERKERSSSRDRHRSHRDDRDKRRRSHSRERTSERKEKSSRR